MVEDALTGLVGEGEFVYEYEDAAELQEILGQHYHAVVANPPYITVKDPVLNGLYRELWSACSGLYALSIPFAQRIFDLAVPGGFTGQITSNSFMKREFGRKLIEQFLSRIDLNLVVDTSGAYIPGHGTPTVIICGRNRRPVIGTVRAVLGIRGEPGAPVEPAKGLVWTSITNHVDSPGAQTEYVSVADIARTVLTNFPWSLSGGGAGDLRSSLEENAARLCERVREVGFGAVTREDGAYMVGLGALCRAGVPDAQQMPLVEGEVIRDWKIADAVISLWPYDPVSLNAYSESHINILLWPYRSLLSRRVAYGKSQLERRLSWFEYSMFFRERYRTPLSITFAFVATHNHFVLDRGEKVFNRSAPVIKLREGATERDHLRLLGLLNSSTACFWLKQVSHNKGSQGINEGFKSQEWERFYEFTGTKLEQFPIPDGSPVALAMRLDELAGELQSVRPPAVTAAGVPTRATLDVARLEWERIWGEMISAQEELDWEVYGLYGLLGDDANDLIRADVEKPSLRLGDRAFEIALARQIAAGDVESEWFSRHRSAPITESPTHWSPEYRALVERRLAKIASNPSLWLIERPECKRRWASPSWEDMESEALRDWLLNRLEAQALRFGSAPTLCSVAQLADALCTNADFVAVAGLYARDADLTDVIDALVRDQHVPFVAALRYTESGERIRAQWEGTWETQRREDAGEKVGAIPVPPKYKQGDFRDLTYWRNRGKLDVPKERFISCPGASRDGTLLLGWAGWDHLQRAQALTFYIAERRELDAWDAERLTPLLVGLAELLPWVAQWHADTDPEFGERPAVAYNRFLDDQLLQLGLTQAGLTRWAPKPAARGRRRTR